MLLLDDGPGAIDSVFDFVVVGGLALAIALASAPVAHHLGFDFGILLQSSHWVHIGQFLGCPDGVLSGSDLALLLGIKIAGGVVVDGGSTAHHWLLVHRLVHGLLVAHVVSSSSLTTVTSASASALAGSLALGLGLEGLCNSGHGVVET